MKKKGNVEDIDFLKPCVREFRRKGFRELYCLEDTWAAGVFLLINPTKEHYAAWLKERFNIVKPCELGTGSGFASQIEFNGCIYHTVVLQYEWKWKRSNWCTLVHELLHVTTNILHHKGLKHTAETDEAWCYLLDSLLNRFIYAIGNRSQVLEPEPKVRPKPREKRRLAKKRGSK